jgi:hypothetical protein
MGKACSTYRREEKCIKVLVEHLNEKKQLGRPRIRWGDDIKMALKIYDLCTWSEFV